MKKGLFGLSMTILAGLTSMSYGQATLPYTNDFESYSSGSAITSDVNWVSSSAVTVITNLDYLNGPNMNTPYMGAPLVGTHSKVLSFSDAPLTNLYNNSDTFIAIDTMIRPTVAQDLTYDNSVSQSQFSVSFVTNGVAIWHGMQNSPTYGADYASWFVLNGGTPVSSGKWVRLTITLNYQALPTDGFGSYNAMFQVKLDGQALTSPEGHVDADMGSATGGSWMLMAPNSAPTKINNLTLNGSGMMDDLVVGTASVPDYVTDNRKIPFNWLELAGLVTNGSSSATINAAETDLADADGDGMANWQEYFAGTQPTNPASALLILEETVNNGLTTIKWLGTTNALAPYSIALSTNLSAWSTISNNIVRIEGTNTLVAPPTALSPAFYRVQVIK